MAKLVPLLMFRKDASISEKLAYKLMLVWLIINSNINISVESDAREQGA